jgi:exodeoxyribonuclease V alpha subunit
LSKWDIPFISRRFNAWTAGETRREFSSFDLHFADFLYKLDNTNNPLVYISAFLTSSALRDGHTCFDLSQLAEKKFTYNELPFSIDLFPSIPLWCDTLLCCKIVGKPGDYKPLIIDNNRLYLHRYWNYEQKLVKALLSMTSTTLPSDFFNYQDQIASFFNVSSDHLDFQHIAALVSLVNRCTIITGGPGTGKTTTVARILALLLTVHGKQKRIALAAPTGKAAARLSSSITQALPSIVCPDEIKKSIPSQATTLHRLLGTISHSPDFIYNETTPLPYDIVVVDEASMIDLALMSKLVTALQPESKLILLGDKDQLSSVEAGSVLGDICDTGTPHSFTIDLSKVIQSIVPKFLIPEKIEPEFANCIVTLQKSYRFDDSSGIGLLSRAINDGNSNLAIDILCSSEHKECVFKPLSTQTDFRLILHKLTMNNFSPLQKSKCPHDLFSYLDSFRILCPVRQGPFGVEAINEQITSILFNKKSDSTQIYHGLPILITSNNYSLNIFNGDTAIIVQDPCDPANLKVAFRNQDNSIRYLALRQIVSWETAYSLTVHKSQGSEFDSILLILPPIHSPVLTRELLYTAVTRAKKKVEIWGTPEILKSCIDSQIIRTSGLRERLWGNLNPQIMKTSDELNSYILSNTPTASI